MNTPDTYGHDDEEAKALPEDRGENLKENEAGTHK